MLHMSVTARCGGLPPQTLPGRRSRTRSSSSPHPSRCPVCAERILAGRRARHARGHTWPASSRRSSRSSSSSSGSSFLAPPPCALARCHPAWALAPASRLFYHGLFYCLPRLQARPRHADPGAQCGSLSAGIKASDVEDTTEHRLSSLKLKFPYNLCQNFRTFRKPKRRRSPLARKRYSTHDQK